MTYCQFMVSLFLYLILNSLFHSIFLFKSLNTDTYERKYVVVRAFPAL